MERNVVLNSNYSFPQTTREPSRGGLFLLILLAVFVREAQTVFGHGNGMVVPDVLIAITVAGGLFRGLEQGFWLGASTGFLCDLACASTHAVGCHVLAKAAIGWLVGGVALSVRRTFVLIPLLLIPIATVIDAGVLALTSFRFDGLTIAGLWHSMVLNVVYGIPVYYIASLVPGRIQS